MVKRNVAVFGITVGLAALVVGVACGTGASASKGDAPADPVTVPVENSVDSGMPVPGADTPEMIVVEGDQATVPAENSVDSGMPVPWTDTPEVSVVEEGPVTSIDGIDPNECNFIHNINACFDGGVAPEGVFDQGDFIGAFFQAHEDVAERFNLEPSAVKIASVEQVEWPDSALGNPEEGVMYAQVITPGFKLVLKAGETEYIYHTGPDQVVYVQ
jgi:hypothetical protein